MNKNRAATRVIQFCERAGYDVNSMSIVTYKPAYPTATGMRHPTLFVQAKLVHESGTAADLSVYCDDTGNFVFSPTIELEGESDPFDGLC